MAKKENQKEHTFSFLSAGVRMLLESLSREHANTIEFDFKPKTGQSTVCTVSSNDAAKVAWIVFLVTRYKETARTLSAVYSKQEQVAGHPRGITPAMESDLHDIYNIARRLLD